MNKRSLLSLCGLAPVAALVPVAASMSSPVFGEMIEGSAVNFEIDTAALQALVNEECAKETMRFFQAAGLSAADARRVAMRLLGTDEDLMCALDFPDR